MQILYEESQNGYTCNMGKIVKYDKEDEKQLLKICTTKPLRVWVYYETVDCQLNRRVCVESIFNEDKIILKKLNNKQKACLSLLLPELIRTENKRENLSCTSETARVINLQVLNKKFLTHLSNP